MVLSQTISLEGLHHTWPQSYIPIPAAYSLIYCWYRHVQITISGILHGRLLSLMQAPLWEAEAKKKAAKKAECLGWYGGHRKPCELSTLAPG